jgi:hyperosmotically inducible periplasmic protein
VKTLGIFLSALALFAICALASCSATQSPDIAESARTSLDQAGLRDVSVSQDRTKGVVTLSGNVASDSAKMQAESIAKSLAGSQVVANQIAVVPPDNASAAKEINSALDDGIESNLDAALIKNKLDKNVTGHVKNAVVTLTGEVNSQGRRSQAQSVAAAVPNVQQVVNELQVKDQKATSTK